MQWKVFQEPLRRDTRVHADFSVVVVVDVGATGKLPSDELVGEVLSFLQPKGLMDGKAPPQISIPADARQAFEAFSGPSTSALMSAGLLPLMSNGLEILDQVPLLIEEVCQQSLYHWQNTLLVYQFLTFFAFTF